MTTLSVGQITICGSPGLAVRGVHAAVTAAVGAPGNAAPAGATPATILVRADHDTPTAADAATLADHRAAGEVVLVVCGAAGDDDAALGSWLLAGADAAISFSCEEMTLIGAVASLTRGDEGLPTSRRAELLGAAHRRAEERADARQRLDRLSPREARVLEGLVAGRTAPEMADEDIVSTSTIRSQLRAVLRKLDVPSALAAAALARDAGWDGSSGADELRAPTADPPHADH
ncbi:MAG: LuxR C-terminal-related transcriptional regulator [Actinomycetota bacterium]|nr:LuxR C-terminal-related transcriptional regulator [Actinomycetota bacterium]